MLKHSKIQSLNDYFRTLDERPGNDVYFYRINGYSVEIRKFIREYYDAARRRGVILEGKIPNPTEQNLAYYSEMMGMEFHLDLNFITASLMKWLPRMNDFQRKNVAGAIFDLLTSMEKEGKTENMQKNAYIKFMCWLYYKFERIISQLGENSIPKILYEGTISKYELQLISILSNAGCDVVLLQYHGDQEYRKLDPDSRLSDEFYMEGMQPFPEGFSLKEIRKDIQEAFENERLYGTLPKYAPCTDDIRKNVYERGPAKRNSESGQKAHGETIRNVGLASAPADAERFFYNCFIRINGVSDKLTYENELFQLQQELRNAKRKLVIINEEIPTPTPEEIAEIKRSNYTKQDQMIFDLAGNITHVANTELQKILHKAFVDTILKESEKMAGNLNRLTNKAVYLLCWLKRYTRSLLSDWKMPEIGCFIYMGGCQNENEAMFLRCLSMLPVDVLILCPNLNTRCCLEDPRLYEINYPQSLSIRTFPEENSQVKIGTVAYHAERELDDLLYQDTGMYRNQQYDRANVINLQTMYEEIHLLWNEELKYRPSFSTVDGVVNIPVIFAKVSGVKDGKINEYWNSIKELITEDTIVVKNGPYIGKAEPNPMKAYCTEFFKNGKLQRSKIKNHSKYPYGILREDMQEFMLDKLEALISQKLIRGIGENGMEYTVIAQVLNLPKDIVRLIQKFDFTKKNPKLIYINTTEHVISLEDSVLTAFLNLIGFDILFFVPTGYQSIEKHFNGNVMEEHQIGEYEYDLQIPDFGSLPTHSTRPTWRERFFKWGN